MTGEEAEIARLRTLAREARELARRLERLALAMLEGPREVRDPAAAVPPTARDPPRP